MDVYKSPFADVHKNEGTVRPGGRPDDITVTVAQQFKFDGINKENKVKIKPYDYKDELFEAEHYTHEVNPIGHKWPAQLEKAKRLKAEKAKHDALKKAKQQEKSRAKAEVKDEL